MSRDWMAAAALAALIPGLAWSAAPAAARPSSDAEVPRIEQAQFRQVFDAGSVAIVDTRSEPAYTQGHIPGAVLWDADPARLDAQIARLKASGKAIVTYCT